MRLATLVIRIDRPLEEAVETPDAMTPAERLTARNARVSGETVRVTLHTLAMPVDEIEARLAAFRKPEV
jgi:hypothetical protein